MNDHPSLEATINANPNVREPYLRLQAAYEKLVREKQIAVDVINEQGKRIQKLEAILAKEQ